MFSFRMPGESYRGPLPPLDERTAALRDALMITDTAPFRYPHYHRPSDTADKLDYERMARVVGGIGHVIEALRDARIP